MSGKRTRNQSEVRMQAVKPSVQREFLASPLSLCLLAAGLALALYARTRGFGFIDLDDTMYVTENAHVLAGLTWKGVRWAFFGSLNVVYWHPATWLSLMLDSTLYGRWAGGFHITNTLLHVANTVLVFSIIQGMTGRRWTSFFVAACFAVHPAHIESVAWVTERKDVLFLFFGLCAIRLYLSWARGRRPGVLAAMYACYAFSLMSKPTLVVLPGLLLLLDFWPLGRFDPFTGDPRRRLGRLFPLVLEKLPMLGMALASTLITVFFTNIRIDPFPVATLTRLANAVVSLVKYAGLLLVPTNLAILYPFPASIPAWKTGLALLVILAALGLVLRVAKSLPWLLVGCGWFVLGLLPVLVIPSSGLQVSMANRFLYFPAIGGYLLLALSLEQGARRLAPGRGALAFAGGCTVVLAWFGGLALVELPAWQDKYSIYERALEVGADHYVTNNNYGRLLNDRGEFAKAERYLRHSLELQPEFDFALGNLGNLCMATGRFQEAIEYFARARAVAPKSEFAKNDEAGIGFSLAQLGRLDEARAHYLKALEIDPGFAQAHNDLGNIALMRGNLGEAESRYAKALELAPDYAAARENLARTRALLARGAASASGGVPATAP